MCSFYDRNTVGIKGADLEDEFLLQILAAFRRTLI